MGSARCEAFKKTLKQPNKAARKPSKRRQEIQKQEKDQSSISNTVNLNRCKAAMDLVKKIIEKKHADIIMIA